MYITNKLLLTSSAQRWVLAMAIPELQGRNPSLHTTADRIQFGDVPPEHARVGRCAWQDTGRMCEPRLGMPVGPAFRPRKQNDWQRSSGTGCLDEAKPPTQKTLPAHPSSPSAFRKRALTGILHLFLARGPSFCANRGP